MWRLETGAQWDNGGSDDNTGHHRTQRTVGQQPGLNNITAASVLWSIASFHIYPKGKNWRKRGKILIIECGDSCYVDSGQLSGFSGVPIVDCGGSQLILAARLLRTKPASLSCHLPSPGRHPPPLSVTRDPCLG